MKIIINYIKYIVFKPEIKYLDKAERFRLCVTAKFGKNDINTDA